MGKLLAGIFGLICIIVGILVDFYMSLVWGLYGGIKLAIDNWNVDNGNVAWGIVRAMLFEVWAVPGTVVALLGLFIISLLIQD